MDAKLYTDNKYVPINQLKSMGEEFITQTKEYRQKFVEIIELDNLNFVNIVETPSLVKKRFIKNVELKGQIDINPENNDYILEIAKSIASNKKINGIDVPEVDKLRRLYQDNENDLTIITNYLTNKIDELLDVKLDDGNIEQIIPGISRHEINFIKNYNNSRFNYSLKDFQDLNKTSYETARKSLDKLVKLNLYKKEKIGKKFIYQPALKLIALIKGGA